MALTKIPSELSSTTGIVDNSNATAITIDSNENVGIGTSSPSDFASNRKTLEVSSTQGGYILATDATNSASVQIAAEASVGYIGMRTNHPTAFITNNIERMRIDASGNLLVGKTSSDLTTDGFEVRPTGFIGVRTNGDPLYLNRKSTDGAIATFAKDGSTVGSISVTSSSTSYNTSSDYRLKENVVELTGATERLKQLNPSRFNFIADADTTVDGFLAHEVADVVPEAISGEKDAMKDEEYEVTPAVLDEEGNVVTEAVIGTRSVPEYQGIDQSKLVPLLVATIQELEARITELENN